MSEFDEFDHNITVPQKDTSSVLSHAFESYKGVLGIAVVAGVILLAVGLAFYIFASPSSRSFDFVSGSDMRVMLPSMMGMYGRSLALQLLQSVLLSPLFVGVIYICHKKATGGNIIFQDVFIGFKQNTANIMIFSLITTLLTYVSLAFCVIPVIFVMPLFFLGYPLLLFENCSAGEALSKSYKIAKENYWSFVGIGVLSAIIAYAGMIVCFVGFIVTYGFLYAAMYSAYLAYVGIPKETTK